MAGMDVLAVSFFFPPSGEPRAVQVGRLLAHSRHRLVVLCGRDPLFPGRPDQGPPVPENLHHLIRVPAGSPASARNAVRLMRLDWLPLAAKAPDRFRSWLAPASRALEDYLASSPFQPRVLVSFGQPWTSHLLGLALQTRLGRPWLVHFSDPWADSPYCKGDPLTRWWNRSRQAAVLSRAARVLVPLAELGRELAARGPAGVGDKMRVLPHCYDPEAFPPAQPPDCKRRVIRYLGSFYSLRNARPLLAALVRLRARRPELLEGVCFQFIGPESHTVAAEADYRRLPPGLVEPRPRVGYARSLALMRSADALLNIEAPQVSLFPSKLVDYIGAGRPILGIVPQGMSSRIIDELGGWRAHPRDIEGIVDMLARYLESPPLPSPWGREQVRRRYQARVVARRFDQMLERAAGL